MVICTVPSTGLDTQQTLKRRNVTHDGPWLSPLPAPELWAESLQGGVGPTEAGTEPLPTFSQTPGPPASKPAGCKHFHGNQQCPAPRWIPLPRRGKLPWILLPAGRPLTHFQGSSPGSVLYHLAQPCKMCCHGISHCLSGPPRGCACDDQSWPEGWGLREAPGPSLGK